MRRYPFARLERVCDPLGPERRVGHALAITDEAKDQEKCEREGSVPTCSIRQLIHQRGQHRPEQQPSQRCHPHGKDGEAALIDRSPVLAHHPAERPGECHRRSDLQQEALEVGQRLQRQDASEAAHEQEEARRITVATIDEPRLVDVQLLYQMH